MTLAGANDLTSGMVTVGGGLSADSNHGTISQIGSVQVEREAEFDVGSDRVDLSDSDNYFPSGTSTKISSIMVTRDG